MKMKKLARVFTSAALVSAMVATMGGMTSFAAVTTLPLTKEVTTDGNTYAPVTTFSFDLKPGAGGTLGSGNTLLNVNDEEDLKVEESHLGKVVYAGVEEGLSLEDVPVDAFKFEPETVDAETGEIKAPETTYKKTSNIKVNVGKFKAPGIYHYQMKENVPGEQNLSGETVPGDKYDGISYDNKTRDIYVYVENNEDSTGDNDKFVINTIIVAVEGEKQSGTTSTDHNNGVVFKNHYGDSTNDSDVNELSVTKNVTGNQGNKNNPFTFYFSVAGTNGEAYKWITYTDDVDHPTSTNVITSGDVKSVNLKDGESFKIFGLTSTDEYKVGEVDYSGDGYTTRYEISEGKTMSDSELISGEGTDAVTVSAKKGNITTSAGDIIVTNDKSVTTPTGIVLSFAPYILLVALAGVFGVLFLRRKKEEF